MNTQSCRAGPECIKCIRPEHIHLGRKLHSVYIGKGKPRCNNSFTSCKFSGKAFNLRLLTHLYLQWLRIALPFFYAFHMLLQQAGIHSLVWGDSARRKILPHRKLNIYSFNFSWIKWLSEVKSLRFEQWNPCYCQQKHKSNWVFVGLFWRNCQRYHSDGWPLSTLLPNNLDFFYWMRIDCLSGGLFRNCLPKNLDPELLYKGAQILEQDLSDFDRNQDIFRGDSLALHATNIHSWKF